MDARLRQATTEHDESPAVATRPAFGEADRVAHYRVLTCIGSGGMGEVFAAYDEQLERKVALKVVRSDRQGPAARERLRREALALARLSHPNVVTVHGVHEHGDDLIIAMEFVQGQTIGAWASGQRWTAVIDAFMQAGQGLAAAHRQGLLHRDFKPDNVMVDDEGRVRVMDFGLAVAVDEGNGSPGELAERPGSLTRTGALVGTLAYMAPEQHRGRALDPRADQFALCLAIYEALYGQRPFEGATHAQLLLSLERGPSPPPGTTRVPGAIWRILERGLDHDPERRYPDVDALLDALRRARRPSRVPALVLGAVGVLGIALAVTRGLPEDDPQASCRALGQQIYDDWDEDARTSLTRSFAATGIPYAERASTQAIEALDAYAQAWSEARTESCVATMVDQTQTGELMDHQVACLRRRQHRLRVLLDRLAQADDSLVRRAAQAVGRLPPVEACIGPYVLKQARPLPDDPQLVPAVEDVRELLAEVEFADFIGEFERVHQEGTEALERAEALGFVPLVCEAQLQLGHALVESGQIEKGLEMLRQAYYGARTVGDERMALFAAQVLGMDTGEYADRYEDARGWLQQARVAAVRADLLGTLDEAHLLMVESVISSRLGEHEQAGQKIQAALDILDRADGVRSADRLRALHAQCMVFEQQGRLHETLAVARRGLALARADLGPHHPETAIFDVAVASALMSLDHRRSALAHMERALALNEELHGPEHPTVARTLTSMATINLGRRSDLAVELLLRAEAIWAQQPSQGVQAALTYGTMATALDELGRVDESILYYHRALDLFSQGLGNEGDVTWVKINLGLTLFTNRDEQEGLELMLQGIEQQREEFADDHVSIQECAGYVRHSLEEAKAHSSVHARAWIVLSSLNLSIGEAKTAGEDAERALTEAQAAESDAVVQAEARFLLAQALVEQGAQPRRARQQVEQAKAIVADSYDGAALRSAIAAFEERAWP